MATERDATAAAQRRPARTRGARWGWAAGLAVASVLAVWYAHATGTAARRMAAEPGFAVAADSAELYRILTERAGHGRRLVYVSSYLHFVPVVVDAGGGSAGQGFPVPADRMMDGYLRGLDHTNFLWVAVQAGIARDLVHVIPASELAGRIESARGTAGIDVGDRALHTHALGTPRTVTVEPPGGAEPVVLGIDASYFAHAGVAELLALLEASGLRADLVVVNRARDNGDVGERARRQLEAAIPALREWAP